MEAASVSLVPYLDAIPSLSVDVDGSPGRFLLDTAGGITVLTPEYAADIGCAPWGQITGFRMRGDRLDLKRCDDVKPRIGETLLRIPTAGVWDLKTVLPAGAPELQGSLALDAFAGKTITLDLSAHRLTIETEASLAQRTASAVEVPVRFSRDAQGLALTPLLAVKSAKGLLWMQIDCGSDAPVTIGRHVVDLLEVFADKEGHQRVKMTTAGDIPVEADVVIRDLIVDGNLGAPLLKSWIITLDLANERLWISQKSDASEGQGEVIYRQDELTPSL